jgi:hypothetical protein
MYIYEPHRKHLFRHWFYCWVHIFRALPRNGSTLLLVEYLLRSCLPKRSLATGLHVTTLKERNEKFAINEVRKLMPGQPVSKPRFQQMTFRLRRNDANSAATLYTMMMMIITILQHAMKTCGEHSHPWQQVDVSDHFQVPPSLFARKDPRYPMGFAWALRWYDPGEEELGIEPRPSGP